MLNDKAKSTMEIDEMLFELEELDLVESAKIEKQLIKNLKNVKIGRAEMKVLIDTFYQTQANRIACQNQIRAINQGADDGNSDTVQILLWDLHNKMSQEKELFKVLDAVTEQHPVGRWLKQIKGVGPTIAAGVLAYFDIKSANYASNFISYAGLNDNNRPWLGREKAKKIVDEVLGSDEYITDEHLIRISAKSGWKVASLDEACTVFDEEGLKEYYIDTKKFNVEVCKFLGISAKELKDVVGSTRTITKAKAEEIGNHFNQKEEVDYIFKSCSVTDEHGRLVPKRSKDKLIGQVAKIPYNKDLKVLLFKASECFVKVSGKDDSLYGKLFRQFKAEEIKKNEAGMFKEQAAAILASKNIGKNTDAYKAYSEGFLPDAHINARAKRKVQKIFVSHIFEAMWWSEYGTQPPVPYAFGELGHNDYIGPEIPFPVKEQK